MGDTQVEDMSTRGAVLPEIVLSEAFAHAGPVVLHSRPGGSRRETVLANIAVLASRSGKKVLIVDPHGHSDMRAIMFRYAETLSPDESSRLTLYGYMPDLSGLEVDGNGCLVIINGFPSSVCGRTTTCQSNPSASCAYRRELGQFCGRGGTAVILGMQSFNGTPPDGYVPATHAYSGKVYRVDSVGAIWRD